MQSYNIQKIETVKIISELDSFFKLSEYSIDVMERFMPEAYEKAEIDYKKYVRPSFLEIFNGLMFDNTDIVRKIYCIVFPCGEVLSKILDSGTEEALIFTHHPIDMETSNRGFLPLQEDYLKALKDARISMYSVHAPLDCHPITSTSGSLAREIGLEIEGRFAEYCGGLAGIYGKIKRVSLNQFVSKIKSLLKISRVQLHKSFNYVERVGIVAGGGDNIKLFEEVKEFGCDTYLTGIWRTCESTEWAGKNRVKIDSVLSSIGLNLIGGSHYATELVVMNKMVDFFRNLKLEAEIIEQSDAWR